MGISSDLSLGCHTQALSCASTITSLKVSLPELEENQLGEHLHALEDERQKIEAFKRELPLCMQLLEEGKLNKPSFLYKCVHFFLTLF